MGFFKQTNEQKTHRLKQKLQTGEDSISRRLTLVFVVLGIQLMAAFAVPPNLQG